MLTQKWVRHHRTRIRINCDPEVFIMCSACPLDCLLLRYVQNALYDCCNTGFFYVPVGFLVKLIVRKLS